MNKLFTVIDYDFDGLALISSNCLGIFKTYDEAKAYMLENFEEYLKCMNIDPSEAIDSDEEIIDNVEVDIMRAKFDDDGSGYRVKIFHN